jgi:hypothetical protein
LGSSALFEEEKAQAIAGPTGCACCNQQQSTCLSSSAKDIGIVYVGHVESSGIGGREFKIKHLLPS